MGRSNLRRASVRAVAGTKECDRAGEIPLGAWLRRRAAGRVARLRGGRMWRVRGQSSARDATVMRRWAGVRSARCGRCIVILYTLLKPLLFRLDAERAHNLISGLLRAAAITPVLPLLRSLSAYNDPILRMACAGLDFQNPLGLAAGFDKRAELIAPMAALGFGHVEVGTVTPRAQPGNDRPRLFWLPEDRALINRLGFNSPGMSVVARNLRGWRMGDGGWGVRHHPPFPIPHPPIVGVNIGKNRATPLERAAEDYAAAFVALAPLADYVAIN